MEDLINDYNQAYHALSASPFTSSCIIYEPDNRKEGTLCKMELTGFDGYFFPHQLASDLSSFVKISTTVKDGNGKKTGEGKLSDGKEHLLVKDCDGIIFFEKDEHKYMLFCELKSSYINTEIYKAKDQICASYIKMKALMGTLQKFNLQDFVPIGIIFSYEPNSEEKVFNSKIYQKDCNSFPEKLRMHKRVYLSKSDHKKAFPIFNMDEITMYYCAVPSGYGEYSVNISRILQDNNEM